MTCVCVWLGAVWVEREVSELVLGITNPLGTGGVLDMCVFGCGGVGGVGGEWAWTGVGSGGVVLCLCEV